MSLPVRVLHIFGRMNRGGAETFIMNVYRYIEREKVQFDFAVHCQQPGHYDEEIRSLGGRIFVLPRPRLTGLIAYKRALERLLREAGPFVTVHSHVHFFSGIPLTVASSMSVPIRIAHSHTTHDGKAHSLSRQLYRLYMRCLILRHATHLLGCSRLACEALYGSRCWRDKRVREIHYGIDLAPYASLPENHYAARKKFGLPEDACLIGHVGRFDMPKNHRFLVEIFEALSVRVPTARLVLVGDGPLRPQIEELVTAKGLSDRVFFMGVRADVPKIMGCLDVLLFPSLWEGIPIVLLEAQAAGVPCVVSDVISREADVGVGLLYPISLTKSPDVWAECVLIALQNHQQLSWATREEALKLHGYDVREVVTSLMKIYESGEVY